MECSSYRSGDSSESSSSTSSESEGGPPTDQSTVRDIDLNCDRWDDSDKNFERTRHVQHGYIQRIVFGEKGLSWSFVDGRSKIQADRKGNWDGVLKRRS